MKQENIKDIDGNEYKTVKIGNQVWMAENLKVTKFNNGDELNDIIKMESFCGPFYDKFNNRINDPDSHKPCPSYCNYNFDNSLDKLFGKLYNPDVIFDHTRNIAPDGWRVPDNSDWKKLIEYVRKLNWPSFAGYDWSFGDSPDSDASIIEAKNKLKSSKWSSEDIIEADEFGFNGMPGGWWFANDLKFIDFGSKGYFWSKTLSGSDYDNENRMAIPHEQTGYTSVGGNYSWVSIRCLKIN